MNEQDDQTLQQRIARLEATVAELQRAINRAGSDARQPEQLATNAPAQLFCWKCRGGNPPDAVRCIWCGTPLYAPASMPPQQVRPVSASISIPPPPSMMSTGPQTRSSPQTPLNAPISPSSDERVRKVPASLRPGETSVPSTVASSGNAHVQRDGSDGAPAITPASANSYAPHPVSFPSFQFNFDVLKRSEFWINKAGIALLLLGLAFFFKYSLDQGWLGAVLIPPVRVAFGLLLGSALLVFGLRMHSGRRYYSQVLLGGSVAAFYITGFASYELFDLAPYWLAFGFMVGVTLLAFVLALGQNESILSLIGTASALATPFVLTTQSHDVSGLVAYTCVVLVGTGAIYLFRGWRSLLWTAYIGGWSVLGVAYISAIGFNLNTSLSDRWVLQAGTVCALLVFWAVPLAREIMWTSNADRWPYPTYPALFQSEMGGVVNAHVYSLAISASLIAFSFTNLFWDIPSEARGLIAIGGAAVYGLVAWGLRKLHKNLAYMQMLLALLFLTVGFALLLHGQVLLLTLALEATVLHAVSKRVSNPGISISGHIVSLIAVLLLAGQMSTNPVAITEIVTVQALIQLAVIALLLLASTQVFSVEVAPVYRLIAHGAMVGWLWRELSPLPNGDGYVLIAWSLYALTLLALSGGLVERLTNIAPRARQVARMLTDQTTPFVAHFLFGAVGLWFARRIELGNYGATPVLNPMALADLTVIILAFGASFVAHPKEAQLAYQVAVHLAVLGWLGRELALLPQPLASIMLSWAAYATLLRYVALRRAVGGLGGPTPDGPHTAPIPPELDGHIDNLPCRVRRSRALHLIATAGPPPRRDTGIQRDWADGAGCHWACVCGYFQLCDSARSARVQAADPCSVPGMVMA